MYIFIFKEDKVIVVCEVLVVVVVEVYIYFIFLQTLKFIITFGIERY